MTNDALDAIDLLAGAGLELMDWQQVLLECWMGARADGRWAASICGNETPRQNGKTRVIQGRCAAEMLFQGGSVVYTSQLQKTSTETFEEMAQLFDSRALRKWLAPNGIRSALGREEIRLKGGARMKFLARTRNGGNGQHGSLLVFDEAQYLEPEPQGSFLFAISACRTRRGPQTIYNGNAPEDGDYGLVFEGIRSGALSGQTTRTAWTEWGAGTSATIPDVTDRALWERANPSLGILISHETVEAELEQQGAEQFAHQRLGWFARRTGGDALFSAEEWAATVSDGPDAWDRIAYGVRFTPGGEQVALAVCVMSGTHAHVEFVRSEPTFSGIQWLVDWLACRVGQSCGVAVDGRAYAQDLAQRLVAAGVPRRAITVATTANAVGASAMLLNAFHERSVTHPDDPALRESALGATRRRVGRDGFGFGGECPERLDACSLALWATRSSNYDPTRTGRIG